MAKRRYRILSRTNTFGKPTGAIVELDNKRLEAEKVAQGAIERVKRGEEEEEKKDAESTRSED